MKRFTTFSLVCLLLFFTSSCEKTAVNPTPQTKPIFTATATLAPSGTCKPTLDDGVSPSYVPNAPERTVVGKGHILTGVVLSSKDCQPIAHARLEFWPEEEGLGHPDSSRATLFTDDNGHYRFECNPPDHIHMKISADGYRTIGVNSYHPNGQAEGTFDIVLQPE